jgi:dihydrofolate synthase/folylpolyglutamate synthase
VENAATAAIALTQLGIPPAVIETGIATARWPGRLEHVSDSPEVILDGAHNPAGARALAAYIERFYHGRDITLIFGAMRDKAIEEIAGILFPLARRVILTAPEQSRAITPEAVRAVAGDRSLLIAYTLREALAMASDAEVTFVTGSLYLVAEARGLLSTSTPFRK